jgi:hypothetical protein
MQEDMYGLLDINYVLATSFHPQSNSMAERVHWQIKE